MSSSLFQISRFPLMEKRKASSPLPSNLLSSNNNVSLLPIAILNSTLDLIGDPNSVDSEGLINDTNIYSRPKQSIVMVANWLSLIGSLIIILSVPLVTQKVPAQTKRMGIVLFTAFSNFGFALANVITDFTCAKSSGSCRVSAWCYIFFQILTCTLVIVNTFRLCGIFLFLRKRSIPSKYIALCPTIAFILATVPAAAGQLGFDKCGHYCWFLVPDNQSYCKDKSAWAWSCFYGWMILFLSTLLGSTIFVVAKIGFSAVMLRKDIRNIADRSMSYMVSNNTQVEATQSDQGMTDVASNTTIRNSPNGNTGNGDARSPGQVLRNSTQERPERNLLVSVIVPHSQEILFIRATLRQSLYPIAIVLSGSLQIFVDLTLEDGEFNNTFSYVANVGTSIQGFLFFLVYIFDAAVVQTRWEWRKYWIWKYYVEFYYSLDRLQDGRNFEDQFMEKCKDLEPNFSPTKLDMLIKPPPYSWSAQYDTMAMPLDFQTSFPLTNVSTQLSISDQTRDTTIMPVSVEPAQSLSGCDGENEGKNEGDEPFSLQQDTVTRDGVGQKAEPIENENLCNNNDAEANTNTNTNTININTNNNGNDINPAAVEEDMSISPISSLSIKSPTLNTAHLDMIMVDIPPHEDKAAVNLAEHLVNNTSVQMESSGSKTPIPQSMELRSYSTSTINGTVENIHDSRQHISSRTVTLSAPKPGDVLSFPELKRVTTIGGGEITSGQRWRTADRVSASRRVDSESHVQQISLTIATWLKKIVWPSPDNNDLTVKRYRSQFRYPKSAYIMHLLVRQIYIPRKARLPSIPNPFKEQRVDAPGG